MIEIDLRTVVMPDVRGSGPVMVSCLLHDDPASSLAVYHDHLFCYGGCGFIRRYAGLALLLGIWDGKPETEQDAVWELKRRGDLEQIALVSPVVKQVKAKKQQKLDTSAVDTFHRYLLASPDTLEYFKSWRAISEEAIVEHRLGWTGSHFTLPVYDTRSSLISLRFRRDERINTDQNKYSGTMGSNGTWLYDQTALCETVRVAWVFEGEYDRIVARQQLGRGTGVIPVTLTNGAGQLQKLPEMLAEIGVYPEEWVVCSDQDEAGEKAALGLIKLLGTSARRAYWPVGKDLTEFTKAGGSIHDMVLTNMGTLW